ncbi:MAG: hypothetical protein B6245_13980 [Desulfobacteraceae bacterium 4572_88]|nr:MAG: hypothetical protein B6245_13980 [Desulfobacteraceae bacterium 4572_88]
MINQAFIAFRWSSEFRQQYPVRREQRSPLSLSKGGDGLSNFKVVYYYLTAMIMTGQSAEDLRGFGNLAGLTCQNH